MLQGKAQGEQRPWVRMQSGSTRTPVRSDMNWVLGERGAQGEGEQARRGIGFHSRVPEELLEDVNIVTCSHSHVVHTLLV